MEDYKIEANEKFFDNILSMLMEGGVWAWKDKPGLIFVKRNGKLETSKKGMSEIQEIVSTNFLLDNFKLED